MTTFFGVKFVPVSETVLPPTTDVGFELGLGLRPGVRLAGVPLGDGDALADSVGLGSVPGATTVSGNTSGHEPPQQRDM